MKAQIKGRTDLKTLRNALMQMVDDMERMDIVKVRGGFYFTPFDKDDDKMSLKKDGKPFEEWTVEGYQCAADHYDP